MERNKILKRKYLSAFAAGAMLLASTSVSAQFSLNKLVAGDGLPSLTSSLTKRVGFTKVAAPYANSVEYFGYIDGDVKPDAVIKDKDCLFYLCLGSRCA